jgi:cytoskeletal protein CcmA (bactofilin family)
MTVLGRNITFRGDVVVDGHLRILGHVSGNIRCTDLEVGLGGYVEAVVVAERVVIIGGLRGAVYSRDLTLRAGCFVEGSIYHADLTLEVGSHFEGQSRRYADPVGLAPAGWPHVDQVDRTDAGLPE